MGIGKKWWWAALLILLLLVGAGGWTVVQILRVDALTGHTDVVTAVAFTSDGRTLVSASLDDTVRVWDLPTRRLLRTIAGQSSGILDLALTPDGTLAVTAGHDSMVRIWRIADGTLVRSIATGAGSVQAVAVAPDGTWLVAAGADGTLRLWQLTDGRPIRTIAAGLGDLYHVAVAPDGRTLVANGAGDVLGVWDATDGHLVRHWQRGTSHNPAVGNFVYTPDSQYLIETVANQDPITGNAPYGYLYRYRLSDSTTDQLMDWPRRHMFPSETVQTVAIDPTGTQMITGQTNEVRRWAAYPTDGGGPGIPAVGSVPHAVTSLAVAPSGTLLAAGTNDGPIHVWPLPSPPPPTPGPPGPPALILGGHRDAVGTVAFLPGDSMLVTGTEQEVRMWRVRDGWWLDTLAIPGIPLAVAPNAPLLATAPTRWEGTPTAGQPFTRTVELRHLPDGALVRTVESDHEAYCTLHRAGEEYRFCGLAFAPDGQILAAAVQNGILIQLWRVADGELLQTLEAPQPVGRLAFSPDGHHLAGRLRSGETAIWQVADGTLLRLLPYLYRANPVGLLAWAPDSQTLAVSSGQSGAVQIWQVVDGRVRSTLAGGELPIVALAWAPDGQTLAGAGSNGTVYLWQQGAGGWGTFPAVTLPGSHYVQDLAYSPDGTRLAAARADGTAWLWTLMPPTRAGTPVP